MLIMSGHPPSVPIETTRRMSRPLSDFETTPRPFEHAQIFSDMQDDVTKMKANLGQMGLLLSRFTSFTDKDALMVTRGKTPSRTPTVTPLADIDVSAYNADEVTVRAVGDHMLEVLAEHYEKNGMSESYRKLKRHFHIPPGVDISAIAPTLTPEGRLIIEDPNGPQMFDQY